MAVLHGIRTGATGPRLVGWWSPWHRRAVRDGLSIAGAIWGLGLLLGMDRVGWDAWAYWTVNPVDPYRFDGTIVQLGGFRYSPVAAQGFALLGWLPWPAFFLLISGASALSLAFLAREWCLIVLLHPGVVSNLAMGNIDLVLAAAIVVGFRWPGTWAVVLLTKVTPGIGLLWFAVRREWRQLGIALGATAVIAGLSFALAPGLWIDWPRAMMGVYSAGDPIFLCRLAIALALVIWGALTNRRWTVILAACLSLGSLDLKTSAMLVGLLPFVRELARQPT